MDRKTEIERLIVLHEEEYETRPCEFYDKETLIYFIKSDRDGLSSAAKREWMIRFKTAYPKEGQNEIQNLF